MPNPFLIAMLARAQAEAEAQVRARASRAAAVEDMENGRCPVTGQGLPQEPEFFVEVPVGGRIRRYGVCCAHCVDALKGAPERFLHPDGRPRNVNA